MNIQQQLVNGLTYESHYISIDGEQIHIKRIFQTEGPPIVFIHGSIENGKIFYSDSGKGLAPFLASRGFQCFVVDLPGRGLSKPSITKHSSHDLKFYIEKVIPRAISFALDKSESKRVSLVGHSWGGVLLLSVMALEMLDNVSSMIFFGSKRRISIRSVKKLFMVDLVWRTLMSRIAKIYKYYPAKEFRIGSDNETVKSFLQTDEWVVKKDWHYFDEGIDIARVLQEMNLPPILSITGSHDDVLGHPTDVKNLLEEIGKHQVTKFVIAGKQFGFQKDYDHISLLTDPHAGKEVFTLALDWLKP